MKCNVVNKSDILKVSLVQDTLAWGDAAKNMERFTAVIRNIEADTDLIVLPEMFTSGFLMENKHLIAPKLSETLVWMLQMAAEKSAVIIGSVIVEENKQYYNRLYAVDKKGVIDYYDKRHLFRMGQEDMHFSSGSKRLVFHLKGWRICPLICYDLRFPVWSRNQNNYDVLIYIANWPASRRKVWDTLLQARAIENQSYAAGVNRVGVDEKNLEYSGGSAVIDARGNVIRKCTDNCAEVVTVVLNLSELNSFRRKFNVSADADDFQIKH